MFDIGWQELFIIAAIAVIVVGPKDLPRAIAQVTKVIRKARGLARDFQNSIDDVVREAELDDLRKQVEASKNFDIGKEIQDAVDPDGDFGDQFKDIQSDLDKTAKSISDDTDEAGRPTDPVVQGPPMPEAAAGKPEPSASEPEASEPEKGKTAAAAAPENAPKPSAG